MMIELLQRLFLGHSHKWTIHETMMVRNDGGDSYEGKIVVLQCEVCGKLKNHKIEW